MPRCPRPRDPVAGSARTGQVGLALTLLSAATPGGDVRPGSAGPTTTAVTRNLTDSVTSVAAEGGRLELARHSITLTASAAGHPRWTSFATSCQSTLSATASATSQARPRRTS